VIERLNFLYGGRGMSQEVGDALPVEFMIQQGVRLDDAASRAGLERHLVEFEPDLLVLDPFRRVHGLDENDSGPMSRLFDALRNLASVYNVSILLVHHLRKRSENDTGQSLDRMRGSSDIAASVDSILEISGVFGDLRVRHAKSKRGPAVETFHVACDLDAQSVKLISYDPELKAESDRSQARAFLVGFLEAGSRNQSEIYSAGKAQGHGRKRLDNLFNELVEAGKLQVESVGRSKVYQLEDLVVSPTRGGDKQQGLAPSNNGREEDPARV
jgi:hypothetical protein